MSNTKKGNIIDTIIGGLFILAIVLGIIAIGYKVTTNIMGNEALNSAQVTTIEIEGNDTLWTIAEELNFEHVDNRKVIDRILEMNDMKRDDTLSVGEELYVPINENSEID